MVWRVPKDDWELTEVSNSLKFIVVYSLEDFDQWKVLDRFFETVITEPLELSDIPYELDPSSSLTVKVSTKKMGSNIWEVIASFHKREIEEANEAIQKDIFKKLKKKVVKEDKYRDCFGEVQFGELWAVEREKL